MPSPVEETCNETGISGFSINKKNQYFQTPLYVSTTEQKEEDWNSKFWALWVKNVFSNSSIHDGTINEEK